MGSAVSGLGSPDTSSLISTLLAPASATTPATQIGDVTAQQELTAMQKSGDLAGLLSDSVAIGVMQFADASTSTGVAPDLNSLMTRLISAYANPTGTSASSTGAGTASVQQSAAALSTNPGMAIIQEMEQQGVLSAPIQTTV